MALEKVGVNNVYNDLSPELRAVLEQRIESFGKKVRYRFDIANDDKHPDNRGKKIYPFRWTLDPITFTITDIYQTDKTKPRVKKIGIVESINDKGDPEKFRRIRVKEIEEGMLTFNLSKIEDIESVWYLELQPKLSNGLFSDKDKTQLITRIDEVALANTQRAERTARKKAMDIAENMSDKEIVDFADAMSADRNPIWDSTQEVFILRNHVENLAETDPVFFNDKVEGKSIEYQATIKQAMTKGIISFDPGEYKFIWSGNQQIIAVLSPMGNKNEVEKLADVLQGGGSKMDALYKKIKSLVTGKSTVEA